MYGSYTIWQVVNFMESLKRPSKLIFVILSFMTTTSPEVWHCTSDDVIDTHARSRSRSSLLEEYIEDAISWITVATVAC